MVVPARAWETGQVDLVFSACSRKVFSSMPGTSASVRRRMRVILNPSPTLSRETSALLAMRRGLKTALPKPPAGGIGKQPASAAPISSSGLVPGVSPMRVAKEKGPSKAPLPSFMVPRPEVRSPSQVAEALRVGMGGSFLLGVSRDATRSSTACPKLQAVAPGSGSAVHDLAAVGVEDLAGHVGGVGAGEEDVAGGDLDGLAGTLEGDVRAELLDVLGVEAGDDEGRPDGAGGDGVHSDLPLGEVLGEGAGEGDDGALGGRVVDQV